MDVAVERALNALGSPVRREILQILADAPRPVGEIAAQLPVSRPAVSKHLRVLSEAELVRFERAGNKNVFSLQAAGFEAAAGWIGAFWDEALARFKALAEAEP